MDQNTSQIIDSISATHPANLMLAIITGTIGGIGVPGNLFLMILIGSEYKSRKPYEWLLFTLACDDFLLCLNNMALEGLFIPNPINSVECQVAGAIDYPLGMLSFLVPPLVAYNRYLSLYNNQLCTKVFTNLNVWLMWSAMVVFTVLWLSPFGITGHLGHDDMGLCGTQVSTPLLAVIMFGGLAMVSASYIFLLFFSYNVILKIKSHKRQATSESDLRSSLINESQQIITCMLVISAVPFVAQMPSVTIKMLQIFLPPFNIWLVRAAMSPFPSTSAVNAYVTVYVIKDYRKSVIKLLKKLKTAICKPHRSPAVAPIDILRQSTGVRPTQPSSSVGGHMAFQPASTGCIASEPPIRV